MNQFLKDGSSHHDLSKVTAVCPVYQSSAEPTAVLRLEDGTAIPTNLDYSAVNVAWKQFKNAVKAAVLVAAAASPAMADLPAGPGTYPGGAGLPTMCNAGDGYYINCRMMPRGMK